MRTPPPEWRNVTADLFVSAELRRVEQRAVVEELRDEFSSAHTGVAVGVGQHGGQSRHHQHLHDGVVAQSGRLAFRNRDAQRLLAFAGSITMLHIGGKTLSLVFIFYSTSLLT